MPTFTPEELEALGQYGAPMADPAAVDPLAALVAAGYAPTPGPSPNNVQPMGPQDRGPSPDLGVLSNLLENPNSPAEQAAAAPPPVQVPGPSASPIQSAPQVPDVTLPKGPGYGDVAAAQGQETRAFNEGSQVAQAKADADIAAQRENADKAALAWGTSARDLATEQHAYEVAREAAHRQAAAENAAWMKQMDDQAAKMPDRHHYWETSSNFSKAMWIASLAFGAGAVARGAQKNVALDMLSHTLAEDTQQQKDRLGRQYEALKGKGQVLKEQHAEKITDLQDTYAKHVMRLETLRNALLEKAKAPGPAAVQQAHLQAAVWAEGEKSKIVEKRVASSIQEKEGVLNRSAENFRNENTQAHEDRRHAADIKKDYDLANLSASVSLAKDANKGQSDTRAITQATGFYLVNPKTGQAVGDGQVRVHKDDKSLENAAGVATAANQRYADLQLVQGHLADDSLWTLLSKGDPGLVSAVTRLGYTTAKADDPGGRITDQDFSAGVKQNLGYDPSSGVLQSVQTDRNKAAVKKLITKELHDLPLRVENEINKYNDADLNGKESRIRWTPQSVTAPEVPAPNATESLRAAGVDVNLQQPKTVAEFHKARALEDSDPQFKGQVLPAYDRSKVASVAASFEGRSPATIEALARKALRDVEGNQDAWNGPVKQRSKSDETTRLAIEDARDQSIEQARKAVKDAEEWLSAVGTTKYSAGDLTGANSERKNALTPAQAKEIVTKKFGLTDLRPDEWKEILDAAGVH